MLRRQKNENLKLIIKLCNIARGEKCITKMLFTFFLHYFQLHLILSRIVKNMFDCFANHNSLMPNLMINLLEIVASDCTTDDESKEFLQ